MRLLTPARQVSLYSCLASVVAATACLGDHRLTRSRHTDLTDAVSHLRLPRTIAARLSVDQSFELCAEVGDPDSLSPITACDSANTDRDSKRLETSGASALARARLASTPDGSASSLDADALHAAAIIDLVWANKQRNALDRSISFLRTAATLDPTSGSVLADLSAAYLVRAERNQSIRDVFAAIDAADAGIAVAPSNAAARFNLALALERSQLVNEAALAWREYLAMDSDSPWSVEARDRLGLLGVRPVTAPPPANAADPMIESFARDDPQAARETGFDQWLGEWGSAVLRGDSTTAAMMLQAVASLDRGIERVGGDLSLHDQLESIRTTTDSGRRLRVARAHVAYASAQRAYSLARYAEAAQFYKTAQALAEASTPLALWASFGRAATYVYSSDSAARDRLLVRLGSSRKARGYPAIRGRVHWAVGTTRLRTGRFEEARDAYGAAREAFLAAHEITNSAATAYLHAEAELSLGDLAAGYASMTRALRALRRRGPSIWLHNALFVLTRFVSGDGMRFAALRIGGEDIRVSSSLTPGYYVAEARVMRAQLLSRQSAPEALRELAMADSVLAKEPPGVPRRWVLEQARLVRTAATSGSAPRAAVAALDSVIGFYEHRNASRLLVSLIARADAFLAVRDTGRAAADLRRAATVLAREKQSISRDGYRETLVEAARVVFDRLVMLSLRAGNPDAALGYLEQARISLSETHGRSLPTRLPANGLIVGPVLDYALIGDTLVTWVIRGATVAVDIRTVDRPALVPLVARLRTAMEIRSPLDVMQRDLVSLYDLLVRPVEGHLKGADRAVTIIADGVVAAVPFAALLDDRRRRFFIEDHPLRFGASLADVGEAHASPGKSPISGSVLLVSNPTVGASVKANLPTLDTVGSEVSHLIAMYGHAQLLSGRSATVSAFASALPHARLVHYAGHAIADEGHPEQSYLALAPNEQDRTGRLTAERVGQLDLRGVRLVVLAACETLVARGSPDRGGTGFRGLARAFLAGGAQGVIGSLWRVDDRYTARLMEELHQAFDATGDAAGSLRAAQLRLLHGDDPVSRSPAAWAGFQFMSH